MAVKNTLPTENLQYNDVRDTLAANGGAVGNNMSSFYKEAANINKWAKCKPFRLKKNFNIADEDRQKANYGLSVPTSQTDPILASGEDGYTYLLPRGTENEPFRLEDFRNYFTLAKAPCYGTGDYDCNTSIHENFTFTVGLRNLGDDKNISIKEMAIKDWYLALVVEYTTVLGVKKTFYKTTEKTIENFELSLTIDINEPPFNDSTSLATYYWVAARLKKERFSLTEPSGQEFKPLPYNEPLSESRGQIRINSRLPIRVEITKAGYKVLDTMGDIENYEYHGIPNQILFSPSSGALYVEAKITNESDKSVSFSVKRILGEIKPNLSNQTNKTTTGDVSMDIYQSSNGIWQRYDLDTIQLFGGETKTFRFGNAYWLSYSNGTQYATEINAETTNGVIFLKFNDSIGAQTNPLYIKINELLPFDKE